MYNVDLAHISLARESHVAKANVTMLGVYKHSWR